MPDGVRAVAFDEQGEEESASGRADDPAMAAAIAEVIRSGLPCQKGRQGGEVCALPLSGRRALLGVLAVDCSPALLPHERLLLEGLVAITTVA